MQGPGGGSLPWTSSDSPMGPRNAKPPCQQSQAPVKVYLKSVEGGGLESFCPFPSNSRIVLCISASPRVLESFSLSQEETRSLLPPLRRGCLCLKTGGKISPLLPSALWLLLCYSRKTQVSP